uniref:Ribonuclease H-like domain-containing protein n=1 Tax=Tanacetum cinerariifolium TaxID=118510 RepID=A0A6L2L5H3_TANCI|nr:ribonuclease H-like domain-containing protein [Tanacetum cinerariifolium]
MHYRLLRPGQTILDPAPAIYASQATTLPSAFSTMALQNPTWHMDTVTKPLTSPAAFLSRSASTWHQRLRHPGIIKHIDRLSLRTFSISPILKNPSYDLKDPNWRNAMYDEYNALVKNGTLLLVPRPAGVNMVRSMWLFKHKFHADGTLSRYKARLVANGSSQQLGVDFDKTFSLVVKLATIRTVLSLVVSRKWPIHQLDVSNAFVNGDLSKTVYMHHPSGFVDNHLAGGLHYLTFKRSDLSYAVQQICLYMHDQREPHLAALKRILRYVQGTLDLGLHLYASSTTSLVGYTDADWASCPSTRMSTSAAWLRNLLCELRTPLSTATLVYCDNVSAVYMSANPVQHQRTKHIEIDIHFVRDMVTVGQVAIAISCNPVQHSRTKHIDVRYHFIKEKVEKGTIELFFVGTEYQLADLFTKALPVESWVNERQMQTTKEKVDTSIALDASLVDTESSGTKSKEHDTSSRSRNDAHTDDAYIRPIYDKEPLAEVQTTAEINVLATDVIETINIELKHKVAKLLKEHKTLKKHYKELHDSIKTMRDKNIEHTTSLIAKNDEFKAQLQEKGFAIAALKNKLRNLKGNSVNTKFAKQSVLRKPILQPHRNQPIVRQPTEFKSERPRISKPRISSQVDVNNDLSKSVTTHYFPMGKESACVKPHHMIAPGSSRYSSNDMVHNHYLKEVKKQTQEIEHSRNSRNLSDSKHFVCSTCQKCVFNATHDSCVTNFLNEVNSRAKVPSNKTTNTNKPVEQTSFAKKPERQIPKGHRILIKKTFVVHEKTMTPRSCLRWKPTGKIFKTVGLSPMYEEHFNAGNPTVSKSFALSDNLQQHDTQPTTNIYPTSELINPPATDNAEENINRSQIATRTSKKGKFIFKGSDTLSWKPCQGGSSKLNLPDHRHKIARWQRRSRLKDKDLKISDVKTKSKDNDKGSRSKISQHEGTSLQHDKDQRLKNSTTKQTQEVQGSKIQDLTSGIRRPHIRGDC